MGRNSIIPASFDDQQIRFRIPYSMPGEKIVEPNASGDFFPEATFLTNVDKPFEIDRLTIRLTALDANKAVLDVQPATLGRRIRMTIQDTSKNEKLTKASHMVDSLISSEQGAAGTWEWYVPYTMVRSEGFQVGIDALTFPAGTSFVRVDLSFQGSLIVIAAPSETR